jgi:hypothetical protein
MNAPNTTRRPASLLSTPQWQAIGRLVEAPETAPPEPEERRGWLQTMRALESYGYVHVIAGCLASLSPAGFELTREGVEP